MDRDLFLINRIKRGDEAAMEEFVRRYYRRIADYCRYHSLSADEAENAAQDTFVKFFSSVSSYGHRGKALNYLYRIAGNVCIDAGRKAARENAAREELMKEAHDAPGGVPFGKSDVMETADIRMDVERALGKLPEELRETVVLFYFEDMKIKDIAEATDAGTSLVKYRLKRAKELLREELCGKEDA